MPSGLALGRPRSDHHLAQICFDLGPQSLAQRTLSWTSATVLKDNASKRDYEAAEAVTILSGRGMRVIQPDEILVLENDMLVPKQNGIELAPLLKTKCPRVQLGGPQSKIQNYAIDGLTSDYAVPILAGFELAFKCDDQHVKNVGAKIRDFSYDPPSGNSPGTLYVQVETLLTDKDLIPTLNDFVELNVLAIDRL